VDDPGRADDVTDFMTDLAWRDAVGETVRSYRSDLAHFVLWIEICHRIGL
jgi:hypothetical protein